MVMNHLLLLGTVGWLTVMLTLIIYHTLLVDRMTPADFDKDLAPMPDGEPVYPPSSMYPHNEFIQLTTLPFINEQPAALQLAG